MSWPSFTACWRTGYEDVVTHDVHTVTGIPPRTLTQVAPEFPAYSPGEPAQLDYAVSALTAAGQTGHSDEAHDVHERHDDRPLRGNMSNLHTTEALTSERVRQLHAEARASRLGALARRARRLDQVAYLATRQRDPTGPFEGDEAA